MESNIYKMLNERYPFLTVCVYAQQEYVGVIQNRDNEITTLYDYGSLINQDHKLQYLELASVWWWESNHSVPINIFLRSEWAQFRNLLRTFSNRDLEILHGPACSMADISRKKSKRRSFVLVRKIS